MELVDRVYIEVNGDTIDAESIDEDLSGNKDLVKAMTRRNRAIGHHHGVPDFGISVTFANNKDLKSKFTRMLKNNTRFTTVVEEQGEGGTSETRSYLDCEIYSIKNSSKEGSAQSITLDIKALDLDD